jgi:outer membrane lipoprotein-sorting protein
MLRMLPKLAALVLLVLPLAGCSESLTEPTFAAAMKGYDKALNPDQQKAAIAELQGEQTKHQGEGAGQDSTPR